MSTSKVDFNNAYLDTAFPASGRIYRQGNLHPSIRVPLREILTKEGGRLCVYDTRGPWGDPEQTCDVQRGLSPLRLSWILERADTVEYDGREVRAEDNGYLSFKHAAQSQGRVRFQSFTGAKRKPRKAI